MHHWQSYNLLASLTLTVITTLSAFFIIYFCDVYVDMMTLMTLMTLIYQHKDLFKKSTFIPEMTCQGFFESCWVWNRHTCQNTHHASIQCEWKNELLNCYRVASLRRQSEVVKLLTCCCRFAIVFFVTTCSGVCAFWRRQRRMLLQAAERSAAMRLQLNHCSQRVQLSPTLAGRELGHRQLGQRSVSHCIYDSENTLKFSEYNWSFWCSWRLQLHNKCPK